MAMVGAEVVAMEAVAMVAEAMEEEDMGAVVATVGGVEGEEATEEGEAAMGVAVEEEVGTVEVVEEETGGTGGTVGGALPGNTTTKH